MSPTLRCVVVQSGLSYSVYVAWYQECREGNDNSHTQGRSFYTSLGHTVEIWNVSLHCQESRSRTRRVGLTFNMLEGRVVPDTRFERNYMGSTVRHKKNMIYCY